MDRRTQPQRIAAVLATIDADVVALQAARLARLPREVVAGVMSNGMPTQHGVAELTAAKLARTRLSLVASDHLPLVADVRLGL